jgi:hypothetical protein
VEDRAVAACLFAELEARLPKSTGADAYATAERLARGIVTRGDPGPGPNLVAAAMPDRAAEAIDAGARKGATNDDFGRAARLRAVTAVTGYDAERSWWVRRLASDTTVDGDAPGWRALALAEAGTDVAGLMPALAAAAAELSERELAAAACATGGKEATVLMRELVGRAAAGETGIWGAWALTRLGADLTAAARIIRGRSQAKKE